MEAKLTKNFGGFEMKILLIDDNLSKIREIMKVIIEVDGINESMIDYSIRSEERRVGKECM